MAKIISQISFADYGCIEILGDLERILLENIAYSER